MFRTQDNDNSAYIAYFDHETTLGFTYDGLSNKISVSHGGMGEPNIDEFELFFNANTTIAQILGDMEIVCDKYVKQWKQENS